MDNATNNIDMQAIKEALLRRSQGGAGMPAASQLSAPAAPNPMGGAPTQVQPPAAPVGVPPTGTGGLPQPQRPKIAQGTNFDEDTKRVAKTLISRLIQVL